MTVPESKNDVRWILARVARRLKLQTITVPTSDRQARFFSFHIRDFFVDIRWRDLAPAFRMRHETDEVLWHGDFEGVTVDAACFRCLERQQVLGLMPSAWTYQSREEAVEGMATILPVVREWAERHLSVEMLYGFHALDVRTNLCDGYSVCGRYQNGDYSTVLPIIDQHFRRRGVAEIYGEHGEFRSRVQ